MISTVSDSFLNIVATIRQEIENAQHILVVSHIRPDGDAVGSLLGMGLALESIGKSVQMVLSDGVPHNLQHLKGSERVVRQAAGKVDLIIVLDVSDLPRLGNMLDGYQKPDINIDHHYTNEGFARINLVDSQAVATAEVLANRLNDFGLPINPEIANALLTGLITDTIGFRTNNVHPGVFRMVADLMEAGGSLSEMYYPALVQRTFPGALYWGAGLSKLQKKSDLVWSKLTLDDRKCSGYQADDDADLINVLSAIEGVDVAIILVEQSPSRVKISWRLCGNATRSVDVSQIAKVFGGGGHQAAAGAEINGTMTEVEQRVIGITQNFLMNT